MLLKPYSHRRLNCSNMTNNTKYLHKPSNKYRKTIIYDENNNHSRKSSHIPQFLIKANRQVLKDNTNKQKNPTRDNYITPHKNNLSKQYQSAHPCYLKPFNHPKQPINQIKSLSKLQQPFQYPNKLKTQAKQYQSSIKQYHYQNSISLTTRNKHKMKYTPNISEFIIKNNHPSSVRTTTTSKHKLSFNEHHPPTIKQNKYKTNNIRIYHQFNINIHQHHNDSKYLSNTLNSSHKNNTPKYLQYGLISKIIDSYIVKDYDQPNLNNFKIKQLQNQQINQQIQTIRTVESRNLQSPQTNQQCSRNNNNKFNIRGKFIKNLTDQTIDVYQSINMNNGDTERAYSEIVLDKLNKLGRQVKQSIIP